MGFAGISVLMGYYGTKRKFCDRFDVTYPTLQNWINKDRRKFLQHLPEIIDDTGLTYYEVINLLNIKTKSKQNEQWKNK